MAGRRAELRGLHRAWHLRKVHGFILHTHIRGHTANTHSCPQLLSVKLSGLQPAPSGTSPGVPQAGCKPESLTGSSGATTRTRGRYCSCQAPYRCEEGPKPLQRGLRHCHRGTSQEGLIPGALEATTLQICPQQATWGPLTWTSQDCHVRVKSFLLPDTLWIQPILLFSLVYICLESSTKGL